MRKRTIVAGILIALGIVALAFHVATYVRPASDGRRSPDATLATSHGIALPPILGAIAVVGGFALLLVQERPADPGCC